MSFAALTNGIPAFDRLLVTGWSESAAETILVQVLLWPALPFSVEMAARPIDYMLLGALSPEISTEVLYFRMIVIGAV